VNRTIRPTAAVTLGGVLAALSLVLMLLVNLLPTADLALPALAGVLLIAAVIEMGRKWSLLIYAAVGLLSLLLLADKTAAVFYILFFGHYPIVKSLIERIRVKPLQWLVKFLVFNVCGVAAYYIADLLTGVHGSALQKFGLLLIFVLMNVTFLIYDFALSRLAATYVYKIRKRFFKSL
jgi:cellulose synthase/poly-beta-1,6-N-acetylglucosamine synthase-like glycosyltransferase